ncbi:MAG: ribosomal protein S18-alanine N-acetyltransferase [Chloroflexota bacterium]
MTTERLKVAIYIRPMQLADVEQVHAVDCLSFSKPWPRRAYEYDLQGDTNSRLWVAETQSVNGKPTVVGMVVIWLVEEQAHIGTLAVHPDYRLRGIGTRLLITALRSAQKTGAQKVSLDVRASNLAAQALYRNLGFEVVYIRPNYYPDNHEDAFHMQLTSLETTPLTAWEQTYNVI